MERSVDALKAADNIKGKIDIDSLEQAMSVPPKGSSSRESGLVEEKSYRKVANFEIYPLRYGELENYKSGKDRLKNDVAREQELELRDIFTKIKEDRSRLK